MSAREEILGRIRAAAGAVPPRPIPEGYRHTWEVAPEDRLARLADRLRAYGVTVFDVASESGIAAAAERRLAELGIVSLLVPPDLPTGWWPRAPVPVPDSGQGPRELDRFLGVMTGSALAIAETGSIVLDAGPGQGRRAISLVPDYHLCVVRTADVVGIVPEAIARLGEAARQGRPITFISGPSATADIELSRVAGVHGPRKLDVLLVAAS